MEVLKIIGHLMLLGCVLPIGANDDLSERQQIFIKPTTYKPKSLPKILRHSFMQLEKSSSSSPLETRDKDESFVLTNTNVSTDGIKSLRMDMMDGRLNATSGIEKQVQIADSDSDFIRTPEIDKGINVWLEEIGSGEDFKMITVRTTEQMKNYAIIKEEVVTESIRGEEFKSEMLFTSPSLMTEKAILNATEKGDEDITGSSQTTTISNLSINQDESTINSMTEETTSSMIELVINEVVTETEINLENSTEIDEQSSLSENAEVLETTSEFMLSTVQDHTNQTNLISVTENTSMPVTLTNEQITTVSEKIEKPLLAETDDKNLFLSISLEDLLDNEENITTTSKPQLFISEIINNAEFREITTKLPVIETETEKIDIATEITLTETTDNPLSVEENLENDYFRPDMFSVNTEISVIEIINGLRVEKKLSPIVDDPETKIRTNRMSYPSNNSQETEENVLLDSSSILATSAQSSDDIEDISSFLKVDNDFLNTVTENDKASLTPDELDAILKKIEDNLKKNKLRTQLFEETTTYTTMETTNVEDMLGTDENDVFTTTLKFTTTENLLVSSQEKISEEPVPAPTFGQDRNFTLKIMENGSNLMVPPHAHLISQPGSMNITWSSSTQHMNNSIYFRLTHPENFLQLVTVKDDRMNIYKKNGFSALPQGNNNRSETLKVITLDDNIEISFSNLNLLKNFTEELLLETEEQPSTPNSSYKSNVSIALWSCLGAVLVIIAIIWFAAKKVRSRGNNFKPNESA